MTDKKRLIENFLNEQLATWQLANENYSSLAKTVTKQFVIQAIEIKAQFNPRRMASSSAKVDGASVKGRACFLCKENLHDRQKHLDLGDNFILLVNPFPIFSKHFTIPSINHTPQGIVGNFRKMLHIADFLEDFAVFYNGPSCGASAPDHAHFQAVECCELPIFNALPLLINQFSETVVDNRDVKLLSIDHPVFKLYSLEVKDLEAADSVFRKLCGVLPTGQDFRDEPMLNILCAKKGEGWSIFIIPRQKHRPYQYFLGADDERKCLFSPASIDLAGVCILPVWSDFDRITAARLENMLSQVIPSCIQMKRHNLMLSLIV
ncbi:glycosyltransferase [Candidatus Magnetoovum chiemensis]|nr:glycosyltransferase [Candidatus Magnetoovum chiemensis]